MGGTNFANITNIPRYSQYFASFSPFQYTNHDFLRYLKSKAFAINVIVWGFFWSNHINFWIDVSDQAIVVHHLVKLPTKSKMFSFLLILKTRSKGVVREKFYSLSSNLWGHRMFSSPLADLMWSDNWFLSTVFIFPSKC